MDYLAKNLSAFMRILSILGLIFVGWLISKLSVSNLDIVSIVGFSIMIILMLILLIWPEAGTIWSIIVGGFIGMLVIAGTLLKSLFDVLLGTSTQAVQLVLPIKHEAVFYVPFTYWIVSIFLILLVHEFAHGIISRYYKIKVKSTGLAFVGLIIPIIPAAFVEPKEKQLTSRSAKQQLAVYGAGAFSNIIFSFIFLALFIIISGPVMSGAIDYDGVKLTDYYVSDNYSGSVEASGVPLNTTITSVNGVVIDTFGEFRMVLDNITVNQSVEIIADNVSYNVVMLSHPEQADKPYYGGFFAQDYSYNKEFISRVGEIPTKFLFWLIGTPGQWGLLWWLVILNMGIGLFNLVPMGPIDGGKMLYIALKRYMREETAIMIWKNVGIFYLVLILTLIISGFVL